jgi:hypothetical protein
MVAEIAEVPASEVGDDGLEEFVGIGLHVVGMGSTSHGKGGHGIGDAGACGLGGCEADGHGSLGGVGLL